MKDDFYFKTEELESELFHEGYESIIQSSLLKRLKGISYLATMDYIYNIKHKFSRYDHSIGVAYLALCLAKKINLTKNQQDIFVLSNLIHDVGHSAFSHAGETFLLEKKRMYHGAIVKHYLRFNKTIFSGEIGLNDLISQFNNETQVQMCRLIFEERCNDELLNSLHNCSINCDRIEGTNRTLFSLGLEYYSPLSMIDAFTRIGNRIYIKREYINTFINFWKTTENLYNNYIYTHQVSSAEAMLTRALKIAYQTKELLSTFFVHVDSDIYKSLNSHPVSKDIISSFFTGSYYRPLSCEIPDLFSKYRDAFIANRFNYEVRNQIEKEISEIIKFDPEFVISHFSYRKKFFYDLTYLFQLSFFENKNLIPVEKLNSAFSKKNISGDFFEIFIK